MAFSDFAHESNEIEDILEEEPIAGKSALVYTVAQFSQRMFSIQTLDGVHEDRDQLAQVFKERSYSIETLVEESFDKESALSRVARFLGDAKSGTFEQSYLLDTVTLTMTEPPHSFLPNVPRKPTLFHAQSGIKIFGIMPAQGDRTLNHGSLLLRASDETEFRSAAVGNSCSNRRNQGWSDLSHICCKQGSAYESWVTRNLEPTPNHTNDHFIHALASSIRLIDVATSTWSDFFREFDKYFQQARSCASWQDKPALSTASVPKWRESHDQTPSFTASRLVGLQMVF
ncbi:hypothetical protein RHS01_10182 [Rhizoctonia solani]|uniref:Uncharacterized protein n=1 Tax=Rhizoctonia solani TaxID=456999 RepID=A0A8H7I5S8_9AGAM|nr:hypothetical protein RHS01_10182 [Rhizoctonia solani]